MILFIVGMVSAQDSCTRPYNRIGNLCCPDYNNDMKCDLHPTSTTVPDVSIFNKTHIYDRKTNTTIEFDPEKIRKIINANLENERVGLPPITIKLPKIKITTTSSTTTTQPISTTINIKTISKSTSTTISIYTTTTQKEYKSSNRITPMPVEENLIEKYKYHIGTFVVGMVLLFLLFLYFIGDDEE